MLTLAQTAHSSTSALLNSAIDAIEHYGFEPAGRSPYIKNTGQNLCMVRELSYVLPHERKLADITKVYLENGAHLENKPRLMYNLEKASKAKSSSSLGLHVLGADGTVAEITLISAINTLLKKLRVKDFVVHINSIGDRDSKSKFIRDLTAYMRSVSSDLPNYAQSDMERKNSLLALVHLAEHEHPIARSAPNPVEYLNDESRTRLRKILEYMENTGINYELNPTLVGSGDCWTHTIFEMRAPQGDMYVPIVSGGRYNTLARRAFNRRLASVGAIMKYELRGKMSPKKAKAKKRKFFITYLGEQARMRAFSVLEDFYNAGIPIAKSIAHSNIGGQIEDSNELNVPYLIIIGHKEAVEGTVIVRNTTTRVQKVIPATQLISYVTRLKV